jgi:hypothetical protein
MATKLHSSIPVCSRHVSSTDIQATLINILITKQVSAGQVGLFDFPTKQHQACAFVYKETPQIVSNMTGYGTTS